MKSVGGLAQTNLEWVLWKEFGGQRGYGRDAIPSYFCEFREFRGRTCASKLRVVLWKEFGGRRGYGRNAIPSYICENLCNLWENILRLKLL